MAESKLVSETYYFEVRELVAPENKAIDYEEEYWGTVKDPDGRIRHRAEERERKLIDLKDELDYVNQLTPGRILDVGCGLGFLLSGVHDTWEKHGVEISRLAAEHAAQYGKIYCGFLEDANYQDGQFDVVVMYHVLEHVAEPISLLREVRRILKPGGKFICATPDFDSACARRFGARYRMLHDHTHVSLFSTNSLRNTLNDLGFEVENVHYPYFDTEHFNTKNFDRLSDTDQISPAFYGNIMTFYSHKESEVLGSFQSLTRQGRAAQLWARCLKWQYDAAVQSIALFSDVKQRGGRVFVAGYRSSEMVALLRCHEFRARIVEEGQASARDLVLCLGDKECPEVASGALVLRIAQIGCPVTRSNVSLDIADLEGEILPSFLTYLLNSVAEISKLKHSLPRKLEMEQPKSSEITTAAE